MADPRRKDRRHKSRERKHRDYSNLSSDEDERVKSERKPRSKRKPGTSSRNDKMNRMMAAGFDDDYGQTTSRDYQNMSTQQLQQRREDEFQDQEAALDNIQKGVTGLKHHAIAINDEVLEHNVIIDELGQNMDQATDEMKIATEKARKANRKKSKVCKMYLCIILLLFAIIAILSL